MRIYDLTPHDLAKRLFPICRSLTGNGVRETFKILSEFIPIQTVEIPSGTKAFDWTVPQEWNIESAYIETLDGKRLVCFSTSNLHVVNYSIPINKIISKETLFEHLHTLPKLPTAIPYVTSYYKDDWGFCVSENQKNEIFKEDKYRVVINSKKEPGFLTYGESVLKGQSKEEILFSTYICHPSLANNELSGPVVATFLYDYLSKQVDRKYTYRFLFVPETIGSILYLSKNGDHLLEYLKAGFVLTCCGDEGKFTYKKSRRGEALPDRIALNTLKNSNVDFELVDFFPSGSDERQFCSPGFNLPVGSLMKSMYDTFKEYHNSLDDLSFVTNKGLTDSINMYKKIIDGLEINDYYINTLPFCEPQLGKRGLYPGHREDDDSKNQSKFNIWFIQYLLNYSDGEHDLIAIADKIGTPLFELKDMLNELVDAKLLKKRI